MSVYEFASFLPIAGLLIISLWRGVRPAVYVSLALTVGLFFLYGGGISPFAASLVSALVGTVNILMIIFGALLLYDVMSQKGYLEGIQDSLSRIHPRRDVRFWFLTLFLTAFFESVAGFGTPGAIVPLLLIRLGFPAVLSISSVLLVDGLFAVSGAVGTPVRAGLQIPLALTERQTADIYFWAALFIAAAGVLVIGAVHRSLKQHLNEPAGWQGWLMFVAVMLPYVLLAGILKELTGIIAALIMAGVSVLFVFTQRRVPLRPWAPYGVLVFLLMLPKLIPGMGGILSLDLAVDNLFDTGIRVGLQPLRSPLIPFVAATLFALARSSSFHVSLAPVFKKTGAVFIILYPSLAITQLMLNGGTTDTPSMVEALAGVFMEAGRAYPLFSPLIGVLGAFMTGSTTVSNIIFGPVQFTAAQSLEISTTLTLGLQLAGASLGNAVCLFNIIAAATVAGVKEYREILRNNLLPVLLASLTISCVGVAGLWFLQRG